MEQHGENPKQNVIAIIPARYASVRLPGKLLLDIEGRPLILWTIERTKMAARVSRTIVATDDERIFRVVEENGGEAVMTSDAHRSGSDRAAEVAHGLPDDSIIVNVQGDEPLIAPEAIDAAVAALVGDPAADAATTCEAISDPVDVLSPNVVKVAVNEHGEALYFSRSPIPYPRNAAQCAGGLEAALKQDAMLAATFRKHTGLYAYRRQSLLRFAAMKPSPLEETEMLEQLRILENGGRIKVVEVAHRSIGVDTAEDLERVRKILAGRRVIAERI